MHNDSWQIRGSCAENYLAFIGELKSNPFDVTVTDFRMESLNGIEMINITTEKKINCPYILLSGHVDQQLMVKLVNPNAEVTLLEKPPDLKQLDQTIEKILKNHKQTA